jgi:hypothetical protein
MASFANQVIPSLPLISGDGIFTVTQVVPNADGAFAPLPANPSTSYSFPLMDPAKLIGTPSHPYMNVALPSYITTLYQNVFKLNTNLENDIADAALNDRKYPTSYAVQQYVQSQIAGTQIINGTAGKNTHLVNTTHSNTIIQTANDAAKSFSYVHTEALGGPASRTISVYWMDTAIDAPRNGASKTVMFSVPNHLTNAGSNIHSGHMAFLYAGTDSYFVYLGQQYKFYQFVIRGDFLDFVQSYNPSTGPSDPANWEWLVKDCLGVFTNTIVVSDSTGDAIAISTITGDHFSGVPDGLTVGN